MNTPEAKQGISLFELQTRIKRALTANFPNPIWVRAEVASIKIRKGHRYLQLVEKQQDSDQIKSKAFSSLWSGNYVLLKKKLGDDLDRILKEGLEVLLELKVTFHAQYGLNLQIQDIDPNFTIGKYFSRKEKLFQQIRTEKLDQIQGNIKLPYVIQRLAVISSSQAAGLQDFAKQIEAVKEKMQIESHLFDCNMQGKNVEGDVSEALNSIEKKLEHFDAVIIVRGGGAKLDLVDFDNYLLAKRIAHYPIPVFTGIGHESDISSLDLVANRSLKTPTAVAQFIIDHNFDFEQKLNIARERISHMVSRILSDKYRELLTLKEQVANTSALPIIRETHRLDRLITQITNDVKAQLKGQKDTVEKLDRELEISSPKNILKRGFSISSRNGHIIKSSMDSKVNDELLITLHEGNLIAKVTKLKS